jgi:hypothetical protein
VGGQDVGVVGVLTLDPLAESGVVEALTGSTVGVGGQAATVAGRVAVAILR